MIQFTWRQLVELYRRGFAVFLIAPVIVALVVVPEFIQHIVEIHIGMFDSIEQGRALANDPARWMAGYFKLAGLGLAMLAAARYWAARAQGGTWWKLGEIAWLPLIGALLLFLLVPAIPDLVRAHVPVWTYWSGYTVLSLATLPLIVPIMAALAGDRRTGLLARYWRDWRYVPLLLLLLVAAYAPGMALHYGFHWIAIGRPAVLLWPIMALDSLAVGLIASTVGAALSLTYEAARP